MPTYEYECRKCGHHLEVFQYFSEPLLKKCPACKRRSLVRLIGAGAAVIFKGSGFYQTDYRSEAYRRQAKKESGDATESSGVKDKKADKASKTDKTKKVDKGHG